MKGIRWWIMNKNRYNIHKYLLIFKRENNKNNWEDMYYLEQRKLVFIQQYLNIYLKCENK